MDVFVFVRQAKVALKAANDALKGAASGVAVAGSAPKRHGRLSMEHSSIAVTDPSLAVPSCANQKLEFLRWTKDAKGEAAFCPFNVREGQGGDPRAARAAG